MRLMFLLVGAVTLGASAAAALDPKSSMPDITRQHRERVTCHNAYDALIDTGKNGGRATSEEMAFGEAYEAAAAAKQPCPKVPESVHARAANRAIRHGETVQRLLQYLENNDPSAYFEAGAAAFEQTIPDVTQMDGVNFFQKAAELGDPDGLYMMARLCLGGQFGTKGDWKCALPHLEGAAKGGHVDAIFLIGQVHYDGGVGKKNHKLAFDYYRQAAERGHVYATYMAAWQANNGEGTKKDHVLAYRLARNLAEQGEPAAGAVLAASALVYQHKPENENEVLYWMDMAIREGDAKVSETISKLRPQVVAHYKKLNAPPEYKPRAWKACPMKTVCLVNQFTRMQSCTTNKDYWSDCDG